MKFMGLKRSIKTIILPYRLLAISLKRSDIWKQFLDYQRALQKRENCIERTHFLEQCRNADIIPRFLKFRIPNNGCFEPTVVHRFQLNLLKQELIKARKLKIAHANTVHQKRSSLKSVVPYKLIPSVSFFTRQEMKKLRSSVKDVHRKKLKKLSEQQQRPLFDIHDTVKLYNLDVRPPQYVLDTLALGPKNAVLDSFKAKEVLAEIDALLSHCKREHVANDTMNEINVATFKYIKTCESQKSPQNFIMTKRYLKE